MGGEGRPALLHLHEQLHWILRSRLVQLVTARAESFEMPISIDSGPHDRYNGDAKDVEEVVAGTAKNTAREPVGVAGA